MNKDRTRLLLILLLAGGALLFFAAPVGDWLGHFVKIPHAITPPPKPEKNVSPLPVLKLRRDAIKTSVATDSTTVSDQKQPGKTSNRTLGNEEIEETIEQREPQFQRCWTQRLKDNPSLSGRVTLQFEISPRGRVQDVQVAESTIPDQTMVQCVISVLERVSFREFDGGSITLTFPLSFE